MVSRYRRMTLSLLGAALTIGGCQATAPNSNMGLANEVIVAVRDPWMPGETLVSRISATGSPYSFRKGRTLSGSTYEIWGDGTASLYADTTTDKLKPDWKLSCEVDKMNDRKKCHIEARRSPIYIDYGFSATPQTVCVAGHDFPARKAMIRVDSNAPMKTNEAGCLPASGIISKLAAGTMVATRKVHWPYDEDRDEEGSLRGIADAMNLLTYLRSH